MTHHQVVDLTDLKLQSRNQNRSKVDLDLQLFTSRIKHANDRMKHRRWKKQKAKPDSSPMEAAEVGERRPRDEEAF